jgi:hypothetical protein
LVTGASNRISPLPGNGHRPNFNITQNGFKEFLNKRKGMVAEDLSTVFGIQCTIANAQETIADYENVSVFGATKSCLPNWAVLRIQSAGVL